MMSSSKSNWAALGWTALALSSHAALLSLVIAGKEARYQALPFPKDLFVRDNLLPLTVLAAQAAFVIGGLLRHLPEVLRVLRTHAPHGRWLLVLFAVFITSAHELWKPRPEFYYELVEATVFELLALGNLVLLGRAIPADRARRWVQALEAGPARGRDPVVLGAALWVLVASFTLGGVSYEWVPHVPDEGVYLFHARYFAEGKLSVPVPPVTDAFLIDLGYVRDGVMISPVPPGWPAILALGVALGVPWLVNPVLGAACLFVLAALIRRLYGPAEARWVTVLMAASPWFVYVSMSLMTHNSSLLAALVAAYSVQRLREGAGLGWAGLAGAAVGVVSLIRPLEGLVVALLMGFWCLLQRGVPVPRLVTRSAVLTACAVAVGLTVLPYNAHFTGDATYFPIMAYADDTFAPGANDLGFGPDKGLGWTGLDPEMGHDKRDVLRNTGLNVFAINVELLGWACGSILPIALIAFCRRLERRDVWMLLGVLGVSGAHAFYWFAGGPDFGARYWYLVIVPCVVLAMRGVLELARTVDARWPGARSQALVPALFASLSALLLFVPWRAVDKYHDYRHANADVRRLASASGFDGDLVLLHGNHHPEYGSAAALNPPDVTDTSDTIFAWDRSLATSRAVLDAFRDRRVWLVEGPSVTGAGFRVVAGPLDATAARARLDALWPHREEQNP